MSVPRALRSIHAEATPPTCADSLEAITGPMPVGTDAGYAAGDVGAYAQVPLYPGHRTHRPRR